MSVVKQITHCRSATDSRGLQSRTSKFTYLFKLTVVFVQEQQSGFSVSRPRLASIHLRIDMAVDDKEIDPPIVVKVEERVTPPNIVSRARSDSGRIGDDRKSQAARVWQKHR